MPFAANPKDARALEVEDAQPASLTELIESKFKNLSLLTSYTKQNLQDKADMRDQVDDGELSRKPVGAAPSQKRELASSNGDEHLRASDLSASTSNQKDEEESDGDDSGTSSPGAGADGSTSLRALSLFRGWTQKITENL